jgi:molybdopterin/thiamine biosynthesis adenylyltransferase
MKDLFLIRQEDLIKPEHLKKKITIVGAGAIGSFVTLTLAKMGFGNITVYDKDTIDPENMNCQFYPIDSIGKSKIFALEKLVEQFSGIKINGINEFYDPNVHGFIRGDIVISAVDSMQVRSMIYKYAMPTYLIDARMGAEYIQMYTVFMESQKHRKDYEASLYSDAEAVQEKCTAKATMYTVNLIAGLVGKAVKDIATEEIKPVESLDWAVNKNSAVWFTDGKKLTI